MSLSLLVVTNAPIYLPFDKGQMDVFGEPIACTVTSATPGVVTAPGYAPVLNDVVTFSAAGVGSSLPGGITAGTEYFVISPSGDTFEVSLTAGGAAVNTTSTGSGVVVHVLESGEQNIALPFKPGNTVIATGTSGLILQGASDTGSGFGNPQGPGSWSTIATIPASLFAVAQLSFDWIRVSTSATINLLQD